MRRMATHRWAVTVPDSMLLPLALSVALMGLAGLIHYEALRYLNERLPSLSWLGSRPKVLVAFFGAASSHVLQVGLFAVALYLVRHTLGLGLLLGRFEDTFPAYLYFSAETYTSLGFGDIVPTGELRLLAGAEALTGLLMISWSASFTYLEMRRFW